VSTQCCRNAIIYLYICNRLNQVDNVKSISESIVSKIVNDSDNWAIAAKTATALIYFYEKKYSHAYGILKDINFHDILGANLQLRMVFKEVIDISHQHTNLVGNTNLSSQRSTFFTQKIVE
jgi:hypothetical protein